MSKVHLGWALLALAGNAAAVDKLKLDETTIYGNREQPRMTIVVPWREVPLEEAAPVAPDYESGPEPLDRQSFQRLLEYGTWSRNTGAVPGAH